MVVSSCLQVCAQHVLWDEMADLPLASEKTQGTGNMLQFLTDTSTSTTGYS